MEEAEYDDNWSWKKNVHPSWLKLIKDEHPAINEVIEGACEAHSENMGAFCCFLAVRLLEMHRVLKETGSIFLHCDPTASHYIKAVMDAIFGGQNFRNEVIWTYNRFSRQGERCFPRMHDTILFYAKGKENTYNTLMIPRRPSGGMRTGYDVRHDTKKVLVYDWIKFEKARPRLKIEGYEISDVTEGKVKMGCTWDIPIINSQAKERTGYPTQKPVALYERIIKAASNDGDWVLDPFCGSGTTCIAAENNGRKWMGMDGWGKVEGYIKKRVQRECNGLDGGEVYITKEIPNRTDDGKNAAATFVQPKRGKKVKRMSRIERERALEAMMATRGGCICDGCGREFEQEYAEVDHDKPLHENGSNDLRNLNLLCKVCNGVKRHWFTLTGLHREIQRMSRNSREPLHRWAKNSPRISGGPTS